MKNFLLINPFGIGDVLFTTPVIRAIKTAYPDSIIGYWCNERTADILKNNPYINIIFPLSRGDLKRIYNESRLKGIFRFLSVLGGIKRGRFNVALDFSLDRRYGFVTKLLGIKKRVGFNYKKRGLFLTDKIELESYNNKHVVEYYLDLLKPLDIKPKGEALDLFIPQKDKIKAKNSLARYGIGENDLLIAIAPGAGASWGKDAAFKHWPPLKFAQLSDKLIDNLKAKVIILGDESERPIADIIVNAAKNKVVDFVGKTSLDESAAILGEVGVLITNDGGPLHRGVALGLKTVSIFGPVDEKVYGPYPPGKNHLVIKKDLSCRPCYKNFRFSGCVNNSRCVKDITLEEVFQAVQSLI